MSEVYLDAFKKFIADGMTPLEALREFDRKKITEAMIAAKDPTFLHVLGMAVAEETNEQDMEQAVALWLEGWTSQPPGPTQTMVMSWYWRAPSKRPGKPGRLYRSTNQAFNAMKRSGTT